MDRQKMVFGGQKNIFGIWEKAIITRKNTKAIQEIREVNRKNMKA
jgi:hypothetical protein